MSKTGKQNNTDHNRIKQISFHFPHNSEEEKDFYNHLSLILKQLPSCHEKSKNISLNPTKPKDGLPITNFKTSAVSNPEIVLETTESIELEIGALKIRNNLSKNENKEENDKDELKKIIKNDSLGKYIEILSGKNKYHLLPIQELYKRLQSHIVRIDHTGVNIPTKIVSKKHWDNFTHKIATLSNLYDYPTGEPWLFILPTTSKEYKNNIEVFPIGREPKFEIVYDDITIPTIQIDLESDLTRKELENILPKPYGMSFSGLAEYFRSVYIDHPWSKIAIRFDIRFKNKQPGNDWDTGKWIVSQGKRL